MTKYLLPCCCGQKTPIESRQAGEVITCGCGESLKVPTMLEMATLELAEPETAMLAKQHSWGVRERLILLGAVIVLISIGPVIYLFCTPPTSPRIDASPEEIRQATQSLSAVSSWQLYHNLRQRGPAVEPLPVDTVFTEKLLRHRIHEGIALLITCGGIALIVVALTKRQWGREMTKHE